MDIPILVGKQNELPQIDQLWKKIKIDLTSGFRVNTTSGHQVVRVYTVNVQTNWKFLLISSANNTMPPVFSVELNAYSENQKSWRLTLKYTPIPNPNWSSEWQSLTNMFVDEEIVSEENKNIVINSYLNSVFDKEVTTNAFKRINYHPRTAQWIDEKIN